jgi:signal transduction histidine kinase
VRDGSAVATSVDAATRDSEVERRWLATLQALTGSVAHELRNALNGVAVNLEVVRSRSGRDGVPASALGSFAGSASGQLEQVITMTDALMALARAGQEPAGIGRMADQVAALIRPVLTASGGSLELEVEGEGRTRVPAAAARLFVAATMRAAVEAARGNGDAAKEHGIAIFCRVRSAGAPGHSVQLRVDGNFARLPMLDAGLAELARTYAVGVVPADDSITSTFPA